MRPNLSDASLSVSGALPNGATSSTIVFDTANSNRADQPGRMEYEIQAPALTTGQLADAATMTYAVLMSANADGSSPTLIYDKVLVQTGAGGAGAGANTARFRLPYQPGGANANLRYLVIRATNSGAGNASPVNMTLQPYF